MAIRYNKKLNNEIYRAVYRFNKKIGDLEKLNNANIVIPNRITTKDLKQDYNTRTNLRKRINELNRFLKPGQEAKIELKDNDSISKWELSNINIRLRTVKAKTTRRINYLKNTKPKILGIEQAETYARQGSTEYRRELARREYLESKTLTDLSLEDLREFNKKITGMIQTRTNKQFRESYKEMLRDNAYFHNVDSDTLNNIESKLDKLNDKDFVNLFNNDEAIKEVLFAYEMTFKETRNALKKGINYDPSIITPDTQELYNAISENIDKILSTYNV